MWKNNFFWSLHSLTFFLVFYLFCWSLIIHLENLNISKQILSQEIYNLSRIALSSEYFFKFHLIQAVHLSVCWIYVYILVGLLSILTRNVSFACLL